MKPTNELNQNDALLQKLRHAVLENLENEQFGVETLSEEMGMSRSHLHRKLKLIKDQSISQFIREIRLKEAMKLLEADVATTSEIAYRVGFNSSSYFHKCFLGYYGYPPGEVKNRRKEKDSIGREEQTEKAEPAENTDTVPAKKKRLSPMAWGGLALVGLLLLSAMGYTFLKPEPGISPKEKSIAVLPFKNLSEDAGNQHFADGLVEDLLNRLSTVEEFKVISRTSSDTYRERGDKSLPDIAQELGVAYIVEGSVQKNGNKARISVQFIDAEEDRHVWAETFDRELKDIFDIQSRLAIRVAKELNAVLIASQAEVIRGNQTENLEAFENYQLGRYWWNKRTREGYKKAIFYYEKAIEADSTYGLAWAGLADTYHLKVLRGLTDKEEGTKIARGFANKALECEGGHAEAYTVIASLYTFIDGDWAEAEKAYLKALQQNPNYPTANQYYAEHLNMTGRPEEARKTIDKALQQDPLSYIIRFTSAAFYLDQGLFQESLDEIHICQEVNKGYPFLAISEFGLNYLLKNEPATLESFKRVPKFIKRYSSHQIDSAYQDSGTKGLIDLYIETENHPEWKAWAYALKGDWEETLNCLEKADKEYGFIGILHRYPFHSLRSNPRFIALQKKMNLPWSPDSAR